MAPSMAEMMTRYAVPGRVEAIFLRGARKTEPKAVDEAEISSTGLIGDHGRAGKRAVTLIQAEHLPVIAALAGIDHIGADVLRRNFVISGLNLLAFRDKRLQIGSAILDLTVPCHPCSRMEEALGHGGYNAMRGHGGFCASVFRPGHVRIGDAVTPL